MRAPIVPSWVEIISADGHPLTYIIRGGQLPDRTTFLTPPEFKQQVGYVAYPAGGVIARHMHLPIHRHLIGTSEVLVVLKGHAWIDVYGDAHGLVASRELAHRRRDVDGRRRPRFPHHRRHRFPRNQAGAIPGPGRERTVLSKGRGLKPGSEA